MTSGQVVLAALSPVRGADFTAHRRQHRATARGRRRRRDGSRHRRRRIAARILRQGRCAGPHRTCAGFSGTPRLLREGRAPLALHAGDVRGAVGRNRRGLTVGPCRRARADRPGRDSCRAISIPRGCSCRTTISLRRSRSSWRQSARLIPIDAAAGSAGSVTVSFRARPKRRSARSSRRSEKHSHDHLVIDPVAREVRRSGAAIHELSGRAELAGNADRVGLVRLR